MELAYLDPPWFVRFLGSDPQDIEVVLHCFECFFEPDTSLYNRFVRILETLGSSPVLSFVQVLPLL